MSESYENILKNLNYFFVGLFTCEAIIKILGLGPMAYWAENWNKLDFTIVVLSLGSLDEGGINFNASLLRIFRISRLFRMIKVSKSLSQLFATLVSSLPSLVNVGTLLLLLLFIYSVAGMAMFSGVKKQNYINEHANFDIIKKMDIKV